MIVPTRLGNVKSKLKGRQLISPLNEQVKKKNARKVFELTEFIFGHNHVTVLQNMVSTSGRGNKKKLRGFGLICSLKYIMIWGTIFF